jgi:hypothetical protein
MHIYVHVVCVWQPKCSGYSLSEGERGERQQPDRQTGKRTDSAGGRGAVASVVGYRVERDAETGTDRVVGTDWEQHERRHE